MLAFLAGLIPSATSIIVAVWFVVDELRNQVKRRKWIALQPRLEEAAQRSLERSRQEPRQRTDERMAELAAEQDRIRAEAGFPPAVNYQEQEADANLGRSLPRAELVRQGILVGGAVVGIVLLSLDALTSEVCR